MYTRAPSFATRRFYVGSDTIAVTTWKVQYQEGENYLGKKSRFRGHCKILMQILDPFTLLCECQIPSNLNSSHPISTYFEY